MPVDGKIKPLVAALRWHGFPTTMSCEGHMDRGNPFPWIEIRGASSFKNHLLYRRLLSLLAEWNSNTAPCDTVRLTLVPRMNGTPNGIMFRDFRLQPLAGPAIAPDLSFDKRKIALADFHEEVADFCNFLIDTHAKRREGK